MTNEKPSTADWAALYAAAAAFKELAPWQWMDDSQLFGVIDPTTGETGYCCVMGNAGQHFALGLYRGARGLHGFSQIAMGMVQDVDRLLGLQDCLMLSFENRDDLEAADHKIIKDLNLKFRGNDNWPKFRSFEPGLFPWFLTKPEAQWLTVALWQAVEMCEGVRRQPALLRSNYPKILVRKPTVKTDEIAWADSWDFPLVNETAPPPTPPPDKERIDRIKAARYEKSGTWEVDYGHTSMPIQDTERPRLPKLFIIAHRESMMILGVVVHGTNDIIGCQNSFLDAIEKHQMLPVTVCLNQPEVAEIIDPIAEQLGFEVAFSERLDAIADIKEHMSGFLNNRPDR